MINKLDDALKFHETALRLRGQRQEILASNIANADTPNFKARDIDFNSALKSALSVHGAADAMSLTNNGHLSPQNSTVDGSALLYRTTAQGNVDGNTVDMDVERNHFTDNALRYEAGITMLTHQLRQLSTALQGN